MHIRSLRAPRGVSLIEAVVALAVMATGLLGVVGVQSTLRANADVAKQRSEGVRLAQEKLEELRAFADLVILPSGVAVGTVYDNIRASSEEIRPGPGRTINATYIRTTTVSTMGAGGTVLETVPRSKNVSVTVSWQDRTGSNQSVTLHTAIAGVAPALAGTLAVPPDGGTVRLPFGRNRGIPPGAVDQLNGTSAYLPPGAPSDVRWVFNNVTGLIRLCTLTGDVINCGNSYAHLIAGFVRYSLGTQPGAAEALNPPSNRPADLATLSMVVDPTNPPGGAPTQCYVNRAAAAGNDTPFACAVPVDAPTPSRPIDAWSGTLRAVISPDSFAPNYAGGTAYRLCRYRVEPSYTNIRAPLQNQNFLVIEQRFNCPLPPPNPLPNPLPDPLPVWTVTHQPP